MSIVEEFKKFIMRGNVIDLAVGVIIGGAFGRIVSSFVNDIFMPPIGLLLGGVNFRDLKLTLKAASEGAPAVTMNYGSFIQSAVDFLVMAVAVFAIIKAMNAIQRKKETKPCPSPEPVQEKLLREIRDLLKKKTA